MRALLLLVAASTLLYLLVIGHLARADISNRISLQPDNRLYSPSPVVATTSPWILNPFSFLSFTLIAFPSACNLGSGSVICPNYRFLFTQITDPAKTVNGSSASLVARIAS